MQYADITVPVKSATGQDSYTYRIPPALLADVKIGQRVFVPFRRKEIIGTITKLRISPPRISAPLKEILQLADPFPLFNSESLNLLRQIADRYGTTLGQVIESATPKPAARVVKKYIPIDTTPRKPATVGKTYGLYEARQARLKQYQTLIERAITSKRTALILFSSQELAESFASTLNQAGLEALAITPTQQLTAHYESWLAATQGTIPIITGTRKAIFIEQPNLGLIIIDQPSDFGYKEEQSPYYHAATVAKLKAKHNHVNLIFGDSAPRLEEWYEAQNEQLQLLKSETPRPQITVIDNSANKGLLPEVLTNRISQTLESNGKVAVYYNRRGNGRYYRCIECETAIYCPRCDTLLTVYEDQESVTLHCSHCGHSEKPPYSCPVCQSYKLGTAGLGVASFAKILQERYPHKKVVSISAGETLPINYDIVVATNQIFYLPPDTHFDLIATFQIDQLLHGSSWNNNEEAYLTLSHLAELTHQLLIQTTQPDHEVITTFCQGNIGKLYENEIKKRKEHQYPPVTPIIRLTTSGLSLEKIKTEAEQLYQKLIKETPLPESAIYPPGPIGSGKKRDKYRYQIILKSPVTHLIRSLVPTTWQLDAEPIHFD